MDLVRGRKMGVRKDTLVDLWGSVAGHPSGG
jgi:hypothetical protein